MMTSVPHTAYHLGQPLAEYRSRSFNWKGGPLLIVASVLMLAAARQFDSLIFFGIIGLILFPFGIIVSLHGLKNRRLRVVLCNEGLVHEQSNRTIALHWRDIATVQKHTTRHFLSFIYVGNTTSYIVYTYAGERLVLDSTIKGVKELGEKVETAVVLFQHAQKIKV